MLLSSIPLCVLDVVVRLLQAELLHVFYVLAAGMNVVANSVTLLLLECAVGSVMLRIPVSGLISVGGYVAAGIEGCYFAFLAVCWFGVWAVGAMVRPF